MVARASSLPTHGHPTALAAAVATALLTAWAVRHEDPKAFPARLARAMDRLEGGEEVAHLVEKIPALLASSPW